MMAIIVIVGAVALFLGLGALAALVRSGQISRAEEAAELAAFERALAEAPSGPAFKGPISLESYQQIRDRLEDAYPDSAGRAA